MRDRDAEVFRPCEVQRSSPAARVDELSLLVHPIVVGTGRRLFEENGPQVPLELVRCKTVSTGVTHQLYRRA
jgi:riboflavin biosynthesis pyrimidine reductase